MLARLRIGPKLLLAPGLVLVLLVISSCVAWYAMVRQNASLESIVQVRAARIKDANDLVAAAQSAHARSYQLLTWIAGSFSRERIEALQADIERRHAAIDRGFASLARTAPALSPERRLLEQSEAAHAAYVKEILDVIELAQADQSIGANAMIKAERAFDTVARRLAELSRREQQLSEAASSRAAAEFRAISLLMPALVALSVVLSLALTLAVRRALLADLRGIGQAALDLASGNLTVPQRDYGSDEIADTSRALDSSIRNLNATLRNIQQSALQLSASAGRAGETAVAERLAQALAGARDGGRKIARSAAAIEDMAARTAALALNAALEAARSGPRGDSVAAMAGEVRALAQQTACTARDIGELAEHSLAGAPGRVGECGAGTAAVVQVEQMTQQNSALVEQASAAAASLQEQALSLSKAVAGFKLDEPGPAPAAGGKGRLRLASRRA